MILQEDDNSPGLVQDLAGYVYVISPQGVRTLLPSSFPPAVSTLISQGSLPTVMAIPPTVVLGTANAPSTITSPIAIAPDDTRFRYFRAGGFGFAAAGFYSPTPPSAVSATPGIPFSVEFELDTAEFDVKLLGQLGQYRLWVDGQLVTSGMQVGPPADGATYFLNVKFLTRAFRKIRFEGASQWMWFGGINTGPRDTLFPAVVTSTPRLIVLGDSLTVGTGSNTFNLGFPFFLGEMLGIPDSWASGEGSTGYIATASGTSKNFQTRVASDVIAYSPDLVVVEGGANDLASGGSAIQAAALLLFQTIRASLPNTAIFAMSPWAASSARPADLVAAGAAIQAAAGSVTNTAYINSLGENWITGTGKVTAPNGTGNADLYIANDGFHPTPAGHDYYGRRIAGAIAALLS